MLEKLYLLLGVPGVGKTSLITKAIEGTDFRFKNFGDIIAELLISDGIISHRDEIRARLDQDILKKYQLKTAEYISNMSGKLVIDTHSSIQTPHGYFPGLPKGVIDILPIPLALFIIEADPKDILLRREKDISRGRNYEFEKGISLIKEHQEMNRRYAVVYSALTGARVKIIENSNFEMAVKRVRDTLDKL